MVAGYGSSEPPPAGIRSCAFMANLKFADTSPGVGAGAVQRVARQYVSNQCCCQCCCRCFLHLLLCLLPALVDQHPFLRRFKGVGLIAPAIQGNPPPAPVIAALRYLVAPIIPRRQIPDALESGTTASLRFLSKMCCLATRRVCPSQWGGS